MPLCHRQRKCSTCEEEETGKADKGRTRSRFTRRARRPGTGQREPAAATKPRTWLCPRRLRRSSSQARLLEGTEGTRRWSSARRPVADLFFFHDASSRGTGNRQRRRFFGRCRRRVRSESTVSSARVQAPISGKRGIQIEIDREREREGERGRAGTERHPLRK